MDFLEALSMADLKNAQSGDASLSEAQQSTYDSLTAMGYSSGRCTIAAQLFGANLQGAISHLLYSNTNPPLDNQMPPPEKIPSHSPIAHAALKRLRDVPNGMICNALTAINDQDFIGVFQDHGAPIWIYRADSDDWQQVAFADEEHFLHGVLYDATKQLLFVTSKIHVMSIDIKNPRKPIIKKKIDIQEFIGKYMVLIGDELHIYGENVHYNGYQVWHALVDTKTLTFKTNPYRINSNITTLTSAVFLKLRNSILLVGINANATGCVEEYNLTTKSLAPCNWLQSSTMEFTPIELTTGTVCSNDGRYLIFIGGGPGAWGMRDITVYDLERQKYRKSAVQSPSNCLFRTITMSGSSDRTALLVFGFIRECYEQQDFVDVPPMADHLIEHIADWVYVEHVHFVSGFGGHWKVLVGDMLRIPE